MSGASSAEQDSLRPSKLTEADGACKSAKARRRRAEREGMRSRGFIPFYFFPLRFIAPVSRPGYRSDRRVDQHLHQRRGSPGKRWQHHVQQDTTHAGQIHGPCRSMRHTFAHIQQRIHSRQLLGVRCFEGVAAERIVARVELGKCFGPGFAYAPADAAQGPIAVPGASTRSLPRTATAAGRAWYALTG